MKKRVRATKGFGPVKVQALFGGLGPLIKTHPGEMVLIPPPPKRAA